MKTENPFKGPSSYEDGDKFYGRDNEIKELASLIKNESLTLLFSRSGTGKSSLIKAGLFPYLKKECEFFPIYIHVNDSAVTQTSAINICDFVIKRCREEIEKHFSHKNNFVVTSSDATREDSLFEFIHNTHILEIDTSSSMEYAIKPLLIFDQFEEIFTNPIEKSELSFLLKEIRCLVENEVPEYLKETIINSDSEHYHKLKNALKSKQKNFRVAFSFREEYLPQFESLRKEIPSIRFTNSRYRLEPFTIETARQIVVKTAPLITTEIASSVAENIAAEIEGFEEKRVDPFLLSLICQIIYFDLLVENKLSTDDAKVRIRSLVENALESYVNSVYNEIDDETKIFIEDRLITTDGKKNSVNFNEVQGNPRLKGDILKLADEPSSRLLSVGQFLDSRHITILHDRLLPPLIKRKYARKEKEVKEAIRAKQLELEKQNEAKKIELEEKNAIFAKYKKRTQLTFILFFLCGIAVLSLFSFVSYSKKQTALKVEEIAQRSKKISDAASERAELAIRKAYDDSLFAVMIKKDASRLQLEAESSKMQAYRAQRTLKSQQELTSSMRNLSLSLQAQVDTNNVQKDLRNYLIDYYSLESYSLVDKVFDALFQLKKQGQEEKYRKLLNAILDALEAKNKTRTGEYSFEGFSQSEKIWKQNKENPIIDSIINSFINKTIYYKQITLLNDNNNISYNDDPPILSFSDAGKEDGSKDFAFNFNNKIYVGNFNPVLDSISLNPGIAFSANSLNSYFIDTIHNYPTILLKSLAYHNGTVKALVNDSLYSGTPGKNIQKSKINIGKYSQATLSPDGKYLITYSNFGSVVLWNLSNADDSLVLLRKANNIKSIIFSKDSKKVLILETDGDVNIYGIELSDSKLIFRQIPNKLNPNYLYDRIQQANFSPDGSQLIGVGGYNVYFRNLYGDRPDTLRPVFKIGYLESVNSVSLSPDSKKMLIETGKDFILAKNIADSNLLSNRILTNIVYKRFYNNYVNKVATFLNSNSIITITNDGKVYLSEIYPEFKTLNEAFKTIKFPVSSPDEALYLKISGLKDEKQLVEAAQNYYNSYKYPKSGLPDSLNLTRAKQIYRKVIGLLNTDPEANADKLIDNYRKLKSMEDSLPNRAEYCIEIIRIAEKYKRFNNFQLSSEYGDLSFYSFFKRNYKDALDYVNLAIKYDSTNDFIYTNLALGYLFNKKFPEAERTYNYYKGRSYRSGGRSFSDAFIQDFNDLKYYGIINKNDPEIFNEVKKIKCEILKRDCY